MPPVLRHLCNRQLWPLWAILAVYLPWGLVYIWNTSFLIRGTRYFCLFDDAMISMRYAANFAAGQGLVWNPGQEPVEGFTNPLWTMMMAAVHFLGAPPQQASLYIQLLGLALLAANVACVYLICLRLTQDSRVCATAAAFLTAFYLPLNTWGLQGMEVSLIVFLIQFSILLILQGLECPRRLLLAYSCLALLPLVRPDGVVPYGILLLMLAAYSPQAKFKRFAIGVGLLLGLMSAVTAVRYFYYHDLLPNTYYLKMTGIPGKVRITRGLHKLIDTAEISGVFLIALTLCYGCLNFKRRGLFFLLLLLAAHAAYSVYVGGDAWEQYRSYPNRYLSVAMPSLFILLILALRQLLGLNAATSAEPGEPRAPVWYQQVLFAGLVLVSWCTLHNATRPRDVLTFLKETVGLQHEPFYAAYNARNVTVALWLRESCPADTTLAIKWAGSIPYFSELPSIDLLGKCDRRIAHMNTEHLTWDKFKPGHSKFDFAYSIDELQPDLLAAEDPELWEAYPQYQRAGNVERMIVGVSPNRGDLLPPLQQNAAAASSAYREICDGWGIPQWEEPTGEQETEEQAEAETTTE